jgi:VCBS repeat-containing protein
VATVTITITPANSAPEAANDDYTTPLNMPLVEAEPGVLLNDTDAEGNLLTAILNTGPTHGTLDLHADGSFTYTPNTDYTGVDTFRYHANDGAASSSVATVLIVITGHAIYLPLMLRNG